MRLAAIVLVAAAAAAGPACAQSLTREELLEALKARDQVIADLEKRVAALEQQRAAPTVAAIAAAPPVQTIPAASPAPRAVVASSTEDDEAALQALSRTLVQRGGLLLPAWRAEFIPSFAYTDREVQGLALTPSPEGIPIVNDQRLRDDQIRATAAFRLGLPWSNQIELRVPWVWLRQSRAIGDGTHAENEGSGIGDVEAELSHQFVRESGWRPDLVGAVSWRFPTGRDPFRTRLAAIATGSGQQEVRARVTAVKAADPMVFFGTLSFAHDFPRHESFGDVQSGNAIGLDLGAVLAVSPDTSLTFAVAQEFRARSQFNGIGAPGSDTAAASLQLGLGQVLTPNLLLDVSLGVGLNRDAPDYVLQVSLPLRLR
jgi:hypothetical protein